MPPSPLPRTAAGLLPVLRATLDDSEQYAAALEYLHDLVFWLRPRSLARPDVPGGRVSGLNDTSGPGGVSPRRRTAPRKVPPISFPAGTAEYVAEYVAVLERLPGFVAALADLDGADADATPLYRIRYDGGRRPPDHWEAAWADRAAASTDVVDIETRQVIPPADRAEYWEFCPVEVPWWPTVPPALRGFDEMTCPVPDLVTGGYSELSRYAATMALLRGRADAYVDLARSLNGLQTPMATRTRQAMHRSAVQFRAYAARFAPIADLMAAELAQFLDNAEAALAALATIQIPGDTPMPQLTTATPFANVAGQIRDSITSGHGGRISVAPGAEVAFSWAPGTAVTLLRYLSVGTAAGRRTSVVTVSDSATPAGKVAERGTKPNTVTFTTKEVDLQKYAGIAVLSVESAQFVTNIEQSISNVMTSQMLRALETDTVAAIQASAGIHIADAADVTAGVLAAIAAIRSNGGTASVVGLSSGDWITTMTATGTNGFLNFSAETGPVGTWLGLTPVILPSLADGEAIVLDGNAASVLETDGGPLAVVDVYSLLSTNEIRIALETWAVPVVNAPGGVATVAVDAAPLAARAAGRRTAAAT